MNTQSIFETQSSKEEIVDIPNKPTLYYYFIKEFDKGTTQKESLPLLQKEQRESGRFAFPLHSLSSYQLHPK